MKRAARPMRRFRRGLSLVEVMMSLAITAMLLTAVGAAYYASAQAVEVNDKFFRATQAGRVSLNQMLTALRRCSSCQVYTAGGNFDRVELFTDTGELIAYRYDATNKQLKLVKLEQTGAPEYVLARNIESFEVAEDTAPDPDTGVQRVTRLTINMLINVESETLRLSGSVAPRKAVVY